MPHPDAKEWLARALRDALTTVPLSEVTVSGITCTAGVTRQAFYYHFSDTHDLTVWVSNREVADQIIAQATYEDWSDGLLTIFVWIQNHPEETRSVISSLGMEDLQIFLHEQLRAVMESIVDQHCINLRVIEDDRVSVTDRFALAVLGYISQWLAAGMSTDPCILTERIARVFDGRVHRSLETPAAAPIPDAQCT